MPNNTGGIGAAVLPGYSAPTIGPVVSPPSVDYETIKGNMPPWQRAYMERLFNPEGGGFDLSPVVQPPIVEPVRGAPWDRVKAPRNVSNDSDYDYEQAYRKRVLQNAPDPEGSVLSVFADRFDTAKRLEELEAEGYANGGPVQSDAMALVGATATAPTTAGFSDQEMGEIVESVKQAILSPGPDAEQVIANFIQIFGAEEFERLKAMVLLQEGEESDGMSDSIPAMIDGQQPAALSEGEYVIPADVVSGLGSGSTDAGVRQLDGLSDRVRGERTGMSEQPRPYMGGLPR